MYPVHTRIHTHKSALLIYLCMCVCFSVCVSVCRLSLTRPFCTLTAESVVYSAKEFMPHHPGGPLFVSVFGGRDVTMAFQSYHLKAFNHEMMVLNQNSEHSRSPIFDRSMHSFVWLYHLSWVCVW